MKNFIKTDKYFCKKYNFIKKFHPAIWFDENKTLDEY